MSEQPPNAPWVDQPPQGQWQQGWQGQPPQGQWPQGWQGQPPQGQWQRPIGQEPPPTTPLAAIERRVNTALALSIASVFCGGIVFSIIALVLVFRAEAQARSFGVTSSDAKIKRTKWIAIVATILWALIFIFFLIGAMASSTSTNSSGA